MERAGWTAARSAETGRTPDAPRSLSRTDRAARTPDLPMMARGAGGRAYRVVPSSIDTPGEGSKQRAFLSVASSALPERCTQTPASLHTLALACRRSLVLRVHIISHTLAGMLAHTYFASLERLAAPHLSAAVLVSSSAHLPSLSALTLGVARALLLSPHHNGEGRRARYK